MGHEFIVAVKGIVMWEGKVLLIKRSSMEAYRPDTWEFPGGKMEFGETPLEAMEREAWEEIGVQVRMGRILYASSFLMHEAREVVVITYQCELETLEITLSQEHVAYHWASRAEVEAMVDPPILADLHRYGVLEQLELI